MLEVNVICNNEKHFWNFKIGQLRTKEVGIEILIKKEMIAATKAVMLPVKRDNILWMCPLFCLSWREI